MPTNKAAWQTEPCKPPFEIKDSPYPTPAPGYIVVKSHAVAINPVDVACQEHDVLKVDYPHIFGTDVAGEVAEVGEGVTGLVKGQRVLACADFLAAGALGGAFQQYCFMPASFVAPIPDAISYEAASVIPLGFATAAAGLYESYGMGLPLPSTEPVPNKSVLLVWGGTSSVGCNAIQLCIASGYDVITTASSVNHRLCEDLGAIDVVDHHGADVVKEILRKLEGKKLAGIFDCIAKPPTVNACREIAKAHGLKMVGSVLPPPLVPEPVDGIAYGSCWAGSIGDNHIGLAVFKKYLGEALARGKFIPKPDPLVVGSGLESIQKAVDTYKAGISGKKVVVTLA